LFGNYSCSDNSSFSDSNSSAPPNIQIEIEGAASGWASLIATYADQNFRIDSTFIDQDGKTTIQRNQAYESGLVYLMLPNRTYFQILLDADQEFTMKTHIADITNAMQVEGSLDNELLYQTLKHEMETQPEFQRVAQQVIASTKGSPEYFELKKQQDALVKARRQYLDDIFNKYPKSFFTKFKNAGQNPELQEVFRSDGSLDNEKQVFLFRTQFWDGVDFTDDRLMHTPVINNKLKRYMIELTVQNPDSIISSATFLIDKVLDSPEYYKFFTNWIALKYEPTKTTLMDSEAIYVSMVQNYITYERAFWADSAQVYALQLRAHEMAQSLIGQKGPNVVANNPDGISKSIADIKSSYVIVYLYNPTCEHCIEETPKLVEFYRNHPDLEIEVFAIAIDTDETSWKNFISSNGMNWINVFDPTNKSIYAKYYVDNTPEIYVLNPERTIIGKNLKVHQIMDVVGKDKLNQFESLQQ